MVLVKQTDYLTCTNGTTTFADSELETFVDSNRVDELDFDFYVIARHNHLGSLGKSDFTGDVKSTDEELRTILVVERSVTATFVFLQYVNLSLELFVRSDGVRVSDYLTTFNFLLVNATEEKTYVVTSFTCVKDLAEHLDTGND
jgi:hypothetical protein